MPKPPKKPSKPTEAEPTPATGDEPKEPGQTRTYTLKIRLTDDERKELDAAAKGEALDTSPWARGVLLREARRLQSRKDK